MRPLLGAIRDPTRHVEIIDPNSSEQRQARRERQQAQHAQGVIARRPEIPRSQLTFSRHWIEAEDGRLFREFGGDPTYAGSVVAYYTNSDGWPIMLEPADPPSRGPRPMTLSGRLHLIDLEPDRIGIRAGDGVEWSCHYPPEVEPRVKALLDSNVWVRGQGEIVGALRGSME